MSEVMTAYDIVEYLNDSSYDFEKDYVTFRNDELESLDTTMDVVDVFELAKWILKENLECEVL